ncbi:MAG: helix-turn-helix transcriptional regulator [Lachnospiraceae bacterium]|nr:helix-turn-helix transcriptional regulator [Lachnospiraceae bacterium]
MVDFEVLEKKIRMAGHTMTSVERAAGLGNGIIGKWKSSSPNVSSLQKVAAVLKCPIEDLLKKEAV